VATIRAQRCRRLCDGRAERRRRGVGGGTGRRTGIQIGVNIAARMEHVCEPGGVMISFCSGYRDYHSILGDASK
jgi:class 3 adenylate cyclase